MPQISMLKASLINLTGAILPILLILFTLPFFLPLIGEERYGFLMVFWIFIGYFGVFDFGLGRALAHFVAKNEFDDKHVCGLFNSSMVLSALLGILGGLILFGLASVLIELLVSTQSIFYHEVKDSLFLLIFAMPIVILSSVFSGLLEGKQKFIELNVAILVGSVFTQLLPLFAAIYLSNSLSILILAVLIGRLLSLAVLLAFVSKIVDLKFELRRTSIVGLLSFGGWVSVSSILQPILMLTDRLLIATKMGAASVTYYVVPYGLASKLSILPNSLASVLFPRFSKGQQDPSSLMLHSRMGLIAVMTPIVAIGIVITPYFFPFWLGKTGENMVFVAQILILGFWVNAISFVAYAYIQGLGKPDITAKIHMFEVIPYLAILWVLVDGYGVEGAAMALSARLAVDAVLLFYFAGGRWPDLKFFLSSVISLGIIFAIQNVDVSDSLKWSVIITTLIYIVFVTLFIYWNHIRHLLSNKEAFKN